MANLRTRSLASPSLAAVLVSVALILPMCAQAPRQLQIEVGTNQQVSILADGVSYGEVLRALQTKLGWEIEIPALADELKLSHVRVEAKQPQAALAELLAGSKLGYAFLGGVKGSGVLKVVVIPSTPGESSATVNAVSSLPAATPHNVQGGVSSPIPAQTMPLSEAVNAIGVPPGVSSTDVGRATTFSMADAATIVGVPPGASPDTVGRMTTFSIADAANIVGVPAGVSPDSVGKTVTLPSPTGSGQRR
jgi:hypothetical protein